MKKPLEGILVVEQTTYWAATTTCKFLQSMGARVIRVEGPPFGDPCRYYGAAMGMPISAEENPCHDIYNGGKESIFLTLTKEEDMKVMQNMLAKADMFITSTRTGGLKKLGLDWETLHAKYPRLIMGQVTGYGNEGPLVNLPGLDGVAFCAANGLHLDARSNPKDAPIFPPPGLGDIPTGTMLLAGVLAALYSARETGVGDYVMASLYGMGNFVTAGVATGTSEDYGYQFPRSVETAIPLGQSYICGDGKYVNLLSAEHDKYWAGFCAAIKFPEEIANDPRFVTEAEILKDENRPVAINLIREYALKMNAEEFLAGLVAANIPSCILNQYKDRFEGQWLEQSQVNGYLMPHVYPSGNTAYLAQMPLFFDSMGVYDAYEPHKALGQDNPALFAEFA